MINEYEKYLETLKKRYIRNGIIELNDLDIEKNQYELVAALSNLEDINKYLAVATDNNSRLQILKKDYTTFYEDLRKKAIDEYNLLYDECVEELYTNVLNQVKIGEIVDDYRVVGKGVEAYVLPDVVEENEPLTEEELKDVKVLSRILQDDEFSELEDFEEDDSDEELLGGIEDDDLEEDSFEEDNFEDEDEDTKDSLELGAIKIEDDYISFTVDDIEDDNVLNEDLEVVIEDDVSKELNRPVEPLPSVLKRSFKVGDYNTPVRRSDFVNRGNERSRFEPRGVRNSQDNGRKATRPNVPKQDTRNRNEKLYDKIDKFSGKFVDRVAKKFNGED